jgi:hypothetical protein
VPSLADCRAARILPELRRWIVTLELARVGVAAGERQKSETILLTGEPLRLDSAPADERRTKSRSITGKLAGPSFLTRFWHCSRASVLLLSITGRCSSIMLGSFEPVSF